MTYTEWVFFAERIKGKTTAELEEQFAPLGTILFWQATDRVPYAVYATLLAPTEGSFEPQAQWFKDHPEVRKEYRRHFVAIHETRGLIGVNRTYTGLISNLDASGIRDTEIMIEYLR